MKLILFLSAFLLCKPVLSSPVLIIGDSHSVGPFGSTLHSLFLEEGHEVALFASCGSILQWWSTGKPTTCGFLSKDINGITTSLKSAPTPILDDLLTEMKPQFVVMEFGGNYAGYPSDDFVFNDIKSTIDKVINTGARCLFVTGPDTRNNRTHLPRIVALIKMAVKDNCEIFESHKVTQYPPTGGDGVHYSFPAATPIAQAWARSVFQVFNESF